MAAFAVAILLCQFTAPVRAQWEQTGSGDLSTAIHVDEVDPAARALLERAKANLAEKQWDEAIETLREVMEQQGGKLIRLDDTRYIPIREYCQMRLAELPPAGQTLYRSRVDPLAKRWYDEGIAHRDPELLGRVVDQLFLSSWTDKALLALGDVELEQGDFARARWCWERISPELRTVDGRPLWLALRAASEEHLAPAAEPAAQAKEVIPRPAQWLAYPDTQLNLADVRARLVLASILEGSLARARIELADLNLRNPSARGKIGGREGPYADLLAGMLTAAEQRPAPAAPTDWPTLGGNFDRTASAAADPGLHTARPRPLDFFPNGGGPFQTDINIVRDTFGLPEHRPAEDQHGLLVFHPVVVGNLVLFNSIDKIYAFDLPTGKPAWPLPAGTKQHDPGEIYTGLTGRENLPAHNETGHTLGAPRFTMTVVGHRLYARLGSPITSRQLGMGLATGNSYLVCLDLAAEGRLVWRIPQTSAEDDRWTYEGSPVCDGDNVFVAMRYSDSVRPQEHVACYDAQTGTLRWRRLVCAAESPARGQADEITNNLLTLDHDTLYLNTNLGAIAAIAASDGHVRWLSLYPRAKRQGGGSDHGDNFYRDLNPCVYYRGSVLAAPADCEAILSLDSSTGQLLWASTLPRDVVHLLGVGGGNLLASGQRLWWLNVDGGKVVYRWPDQTTIHGYGRGALVGDEVYFPTRTEIYVFRQALGRTPTGISKAAGNDPNWPQVRDAIRLDTRNPPMSGGNLVVASGYLLIATPDKLIALGPHAAPARPNEHEVTQAAATRPTEMPEPTHDSAEP